MATTYRLVTVLHGYGTSHTSDYWPDGDGCSWSGYATSFDQYLEEVSCYITSANCEFYFIDKDAKAKQITNDKSLKSAVESLPDGGTLAISAIICSKGKKQGQSPSEGSGLSNFKSLKVEKNESKARAIVERFSICYGEICHYSGIVMWSGPCYRYKWGRGYIISEKSYKNLPKDEKDYWELAATDWDEDVPSAPLYRDSQHSIRDDVRHLQYLLTRLGYLDLSDTKQQTGSYQSCTERAVRKFREDYDIGSSSGYDIEDYTKETEKQLAKIVRKLRSEGHKYL